MRVIRETGLWRLSGWDELGTLVHVKNLVSTVTVGRMQKQLPAFHVIELMSESQFNEMCRNSFYET